MEFEFIDIADIDSSPESEQHVGNGIADIVTVDECQQKKDVSHVDASKQRKVQAGSTLSTDISCNSVKRKKCKHSIPTMSLTDLVYLILKNENCMLTSQIWDYISGLFPYYEHSYPPLIGNIKVVSVISKSPKLFLKSNSVDGSVTKRVILNPAMEYYHDIILEKAKTKMTNLLSSLYLPDIHTDFLAGCLNLKDTTLFRLKTRPQSFTNNANEAGRSSNPILPLGPPKKKRKRACSTIKHEDQIDKFKSNDTYSSDEFNPKIVACQTVTPLTITQHPEPLVAEPDTYTFLDASVILDSIQTHSEDGVPINFVNCVWSNNAIDDVDVEGIDDVPAERNSFPEVEKCIPKWREIFPWVIWHSEERTIGCSECQFAQKKSGSRELVSVVVIKNANEIFKVSKILRLHGAKTSHKLTKILTSKQLIAILHFLLTLHFNDFCSPNDILDSCRSLCDEATDVTQESVCFAFRILGEYLEHRTVLLINKATRIVVISDPCSGIIIVRLFNGFNYIEEHIIASYMSVIDKTPMEHLVSLGIDETKVILYVANRRCEECARCANTKKPLFKTILPLRLPNLEKFLLFLWRTSLLYPIHALGTTIRKLWKSHPHRFCNVLNIPLEKFGRFIYNPIVLVDLYENMSEIKKSALSIYEANGHLEALGLYHSDPTNFKLFLPLFPILTNIITLLVQVKCSHPVDNDQLQLSQSIQSIRDICLEWRDKVNHAEYSILTKQVDEMLGLISLTVKEFFEPIYFKGRNIPLAFNRTNNLEHLKKFNNCREKNKSFSAVFSVIKSFYEYDKDTLYSGLLSFLEGNPAALRYDVGKLLDTLNEGTSQRLAHPEVYQFLKLVGLMPFNSAHVNRCIFEVKVYQSKFYNSPWAGIGFEVKENLLTILSELNNKKRLSDVDMFRWWKDKYFHTG